MSIYKYGLRSKEFIFNLMKKAIFLSLLFLPLFTGINLSPTEAVEINCNSSVWKNKERCKDKKTAKKKKKDKRPELLTTTGKINYPFKLEKIGMLDLSTGKTKPITLSAETKNVIEIIPKEGEKDFINADSILQWTVGDYSEVKFSGANAIAGGGGFAAGAIIGGGPAAPFLLLASPFYGMIAGNKAYPEWRVLVKELGDDGREKQILLQAVNEQNAFAIRSIVASASGLEAGVKKSEGEIAILRENKLKNLEKESFTLETELVSLYSKNEICSSDNEIYNDKKIERYKELSNLINGLRKSLRIDSSFKNICSTTESLNID